MQLKAVIVQKLHKIRRHRIAGRLVANLVHGGGGGSSTLTFPDFYRIREASRREDFKPTKKQKRGNEALETGAKTKQPKEVEIKVGLAYVNDGVFKARRNKTNVLKVKNDIERDELIEKAIT